MVRKEKSQRKEDVAVLILNNIYKSVTHYFDTLSVLGYKKQSDVDKLIVFNFIGELLTGEMRHLITESDYRKMEQALSCLYGTSCLIPYPEYVNSNSLFGTLTNGGIIITRITEDSNIRNTENDLIRFKAANYDN